MARGMKILHSPRAEHGSDEFGSVQIWRQGCSMTGPWSPPGADLTTIYQTITVYFFTASTLNLIDQMDSPEHTRAQATSELNIRKEPTIKEIQLRHGSQKLDLI